MSESPEVAWYRAMLKPQPVRAGDENALLAGDILSIWHDPKYHATVDGQFLTWMTDDETAVDVFYVGNDSLRFCVRRPGWSHDSETMSIDALRKGGAGVIADVRLAALRDLSNRHVVAPVSFSRPHAAAAHGSRLVG